MSAVIIDGGMIEKVVSTSMKMRFWNAEVREAEGAFPARRPFGNSTTSVFIDRGTRMGRGYFIKCNPPGV